MKRIRSSRPHALAIASKVVALLAAFLVFATFLVPRVAHAEEDDGVRLRLGLNLGGGVVVGDATGPVVGGGIRGGLQLSNLVGLYVQTGANVLIASPKGGGDATAVAFIPFTGMVSISPISQLELAIGPSLDYYGGATKSGSGGGAAFGIAGRVSLHPFARSGFAIGADIHPLFVSGLAIVPITFGLGFDIR